MSTIVVKRPVATVVSPVPKAMGKNKNSAAAVAAKEAKEAEKAAAAKEAGIGGLSAYGCSMSYSSRPAVGGGSCSLGVGLGLGLHLGEWWWWVIVGDRSHTNHPRRRNGVRTGQLRIGD